MSVQKIQTVGSPAVPRRGTLWRVGAAAVAAVAVLARGLGTAVLSLVVAVWVLVVALSCLVGLGLILVPSAARTVRGVADLERARLSRQGPEVLAPGPAPPGWRAVLSDRTLTRELGWLVLHATAGLLLGLVGVLVALFAVRDLSFPLWAWAAPADTTASSIGLGVAGDWRAVLATGLLGLGWVAVLVGLAPAMARLQAWPGRRLLTPGSDVDLGLRVAQLTATRAAALDAHATELRRIERSLHDGSQNRLVAVTVLLGAARRMLTRDPAAVDEVLERAQAAAEQALAELRTVVRGILPPVLADRGLAGALSGLAASCPVPCAVRVEVPGRCPASVESTAYFVVAEALTNVARHSQATTATVLVERRGGSLHVQVRDDGAGGVEEAGSVRGSGGSGLAGIRDRVAGHDGTLRVSSPPGGPTVVEVEIPCGW